VETVKVYWKTKAIVHLKKQANWYSENMGTSAANKLWNGMIAAGDLLTANPYLGKIE
jgi:plasmid stabilization system protein ParE